MPAVSVIVPNFNHGKFLAERLESIFNQSFQDFEVILLDDASTDNSRNIIDSYKHHPKLALTLYNDVNSGSGFKQWQKGFDLAKGKYIWIAESDDVADPAFLEALTKILDENPPVNVAFCQSLVFDDENSIQYNNIKWTHDLQYVDWTKPFEITGENAIRHMFLFKNIIPNASAVLFRSKMLKGLNDDFTKFRYTGDWLVWVEYLLCGNLSYTPLLLNKFRVHENVSRKRKGIDKNVAYLLEIYAIHARILEKLAIPREVMNNARQYFAERVYKEMGVRKFLSAMGFSLACKLQKYDRLFLWRFLKCSVKSRALRHASIPSIFV